MITKGDLIACSTPYVFALCPQETNIRCEQCFKVLVTKILCQQCSNAAFCSRKCQNDCASQRNHEYECQLMASRPISAMSRLVSRVIQKIEQKDNDYVESIGSYRRDWDCLMDHYDDIVRDATVMYQFDGILTDLEAIFGDKLPDVRSVIKIYGKILINSFAVQDEMMRQIGRAVYLGPSIFDHSCVPNAAFVFIGTTIFVKAIKDIPSNNIKDVRLSYIDEFESTDERRRQLQAMYYFQCECERCTDQHLSAIDMSEDSTLRPICDKLDQLTEGNKYLFHIDLSGRNRRNTQIYKCLQTDSISSDDKSEQLIKLLIESRCKVGSMKNILELRIADLISFYEKDVDLSLSIIDIYRSYYGKCHPKIALRLYLTAQHTEKNSTLRKRLLFEARNIAYVITPSFSEFQNFANNTVAKEHRSRTIYKFSHIYKICDSLTNQTLLSIIDDELNEFRSAINNVSGKSVRVDRMEKTALMPVCVNNNYYAKQHQNNSNNNSYHHNNNKASHSATQRIRSRSLNRDYGRFGI